MSVSFIEFCLASRHDEVVNIPKLIFIATSAVRVTISQCSGVSGFFVLVFILSAVFLNLDICSM